MLHSVFTLSLYFALRLGNGMLLRLENMFSNLAKRQMLQW
jgi:hypothetical protein